MNYLNVILLSFSISCVLGATDLPGSTAGSHNITDHIRTTKIKSNDCIYTQGSKLEIDLKFLNVTSHCQGYTSGRYIVSRGFTCDFKAVGMQNQDGTLNEVCIRAMLVNEKYVTSEVEKIIDKCLINGTNKRLRALNFFNCLNSALRPNTTSDSQNITDDAKTTGTKSNACIFKMDSLETEKKKIDIHCRHLLCRFKASGIQDQDGTLNEECIQAKLLNEGFVPSKAEKITKNCLVNDKNAETTAMEFETCLDKHQYINFVYAYNNKLEMMFIEAKRKCGSNSTATGQVFTAADMMCYFKNMGVVNKDGTFDITIMYAAIYHNKLNVDKFKICQKHNVILTDEEDLETIARNLHNCLFFM